MRPAAEPPSGHAHLRESRDFEVQFKIPFDSIKGMILKHPRIPLSPRHRVSDYNKELKSLPPSSSFARFLYENLAVKELAASEYEGRKRPDQFRRTNRFDRTRQPENCVPRLPSTDVESDPPIDAFVERNL